MLRDLQSLSMIRVKRRQFLVATTAVFVGAAVPGSLLDRLAAAGGTSRWSPVPPGAASENRPAEHFLLVRKALADSDNLFGPRQAMPAATSQIEAIQHVRRTLQGADLQELLKVQVQFADLLGWLHQDSGDFSTAQFWMDRALEWSHLAGDHDSVVFVLARKSQLAGDMSDPIEAVGIAEAALRLARKRSRMGAIAASYAAHGHALRGDRPACDRLYDHATSLLEQAEPDESPWGMFFDVPYIAMQHARSLAILGAYREAAERFHAAMDDLQQGYHRDRGVYLAREALAHAGAGEAEHAARLGVQALAIGAETNSDRIFKELATLGDALCYRESTTDVAHFLTALTETAQSRSALTRESSL
jgi:tetratricopeptide (TPR) repeat protein